jgi:hypothetical protein
LANGAVSRVPGQTHRRIGAEAAFDRHAALLLADGLAGVEHRGHRIDLPRICLHLRARQSERVLRLRLIKRVADQRHARVVVDHEPKLGVELVARSLAVIAITAGPEVIGCHHEIDAARLAA